MRPASRPLLLFGPTIAVGVVAAVVTLGARDADPVFVSAQRHPGSVEPAVLSNALLLTREPLPGGDGGPARQARCRPGSAEGPLRNPWSCSIRYASGRTIRYRIRVRLTGVFHGTNSRGDAVIDGHIPAPGGG